MPPSPSRAELEAAEDGVREVVQDVLDDLHDGKLTRAEAAEEVRIRASHAESAAEYLLLQGAFRLFMRAGEYPRAADLLRHMHDREFSPEALASLAEQALEPVPRGVPVAGLDGLLATLHDEIAHARKRTAEQELGNAFDNLFLSNTFSSGSDGTILDVVETVRACMREHGGPYFNVFLQSPSVDGGIPALPPIQLMYPRLRVLLKAACSRRFARAGRSGDQRDRALLCVAADIIRQIAQLLVIGSLRVDHKQLRCIMRHLIDLTARYFIHAEASLPVPVLDLLAQPDIPAEERQNTGR